MIAVDRGSDDELNSLDSDGYLGALPVLHVFTNHGIYSIEHPKLFDSLGEFIYKCLEETHGITGKLIREDGTTFEKDQLIRAQINVFHCSFLFHEDALTETVKAIIDSSIKMRKGK